MGEIVTHGASNHVLQKCLVVWGVHPDKKAFFLSLLAGKITRVACEKHGCCVLQRVLDACREAQAEHGFILRELLADVARTSDSPYGNYVIQYAIKSGVSPEFTRQVLRSLVSGDVDPRDSCEDFVRVCCQKFSSNVVEQALQYSAYQEREIVFSKLVEGDALKRILPDRFGNYIVQRALDLSVGTEWFQPLIMGVRQLLENDPTGTAIGIRAKLVKKYYPMLQ